MSIILQNISKKYEDTYALKNIDLEIKDADTTVLIGPSGCGKSTLIRLVTGLIKADSGEVKINEKTVSRNNLMEIRRNIGYVIQDGGLFPHLTAEENVSLTSRYLKMPKDKIKERINELADLTKFPKKGLRKFPLELSGGQQQRVSLMRALMLNPEILLLDEPLGALDPLIRYDLQTDLREIFESLNKTVLMVTHDLSEAVFFGDEIILLKNGVIIQKGLLKDFLENPADDFVTKFIKAQRSLDYKNA